MSLISISSTPSAPCYILRLPRVNIMLDCALDITPTLNFEPLQLVPRTSPHKAMYDASSRPRRQNFLDEPLEYALPALDLFDMETVDVILVSNCHTMMALPYITQHSAFKGVVYATEPTVQFAKQAFATMTEHTYRIPRTQSMSPSWKEMYAQASEVHGTTPPPAYGSDDGKVVSWRELFTRDEAFAALTTVEAVSYNQKLEIFGRVQITAHSAGYSIGSANWAIEIADKRLVYVGTSSLATDRPPMPLDVEALRNADVCVLGGLASRTNATPPHERMAELLRHVAGTVAAGSPVLLPVHSTGTVYELLEAVVTHLAHSQLPTVPVYFVSPTAKESLSYANICAQWLNKTRAGKVMLPEWPFQHAEHVANGIIQVFPSLSAEFSTAYREPCVIFADSPNLRSGDAPQLVKMLTTPARGACCLLTDPALDPAAVVGPFHPLALKVLTCAIDPALSVAGASGLLADIAPQRVVVPSALLLPIPLRAHGRYNGDGHVPDAKHALRYDRGEVVGLEVGVPVEVLATTFERAHIGAALARTLVPVRVDHTTSAVAVAAQLDARDYQYRIDVHDHAHAAPPTGQRVLFGSIRPRRLVQALAQHGIRHVSISQRGDTDILTLHGHNARIELTGSKTLVKTNGADASLREALRGTILSLLTEL